MQHFSNSKKTLKRVKSKSPESTKNSLNLKCSKSKEKLFNLSKNLYINDFNLN